MSGKKTIQAYHPDRWAVIASYAYGLLMAVSVGYFVYGIPVQVSDSFGNMLNVRGSWSELLESTFYNRAYLRPFMWAEIKLVFDASQGAYTEWFRGVQVAQVFVLVVLFLRLVRPRTWRDAALVPLGMAALIGGDTFGGTINEAFPVNHFLTILLCCLTAANLALARHRWWVDVAAALLFIVSVLTIESGLLVWVIFVGAWLLGARSLSRTGLAVQFALLAGYFLLRFAFLDVGTPDLSERSSGFGFQSLDPPELIQRFGAFPYWFYAYNVAASFLTVLFAEPREGIFWGVNGLVVGSVDVANGIQVIATSFGTMLIAVFAYRRWRKWLGRRLDRDDMVVALFVMVLAANAVISYAYTKDVVMSPAGVFYAAALFVSARDVLFDWIDRPGAMPTLITVIFCLVLGLTWSIRGVATHLDLRTAAVGVRNEWVYVNQWIVRQGLQLDSDERELLRYFRDEAIVRHPVRPRLRKLDELPFLGVRLPFHDGRGVE